MDQTDQEPVKRKAGRPKGAKNKVKLPSEADLIADYSKGHDKALKKMLKIMENGSESMQFKAACKVSDTYFKLLQDGDKMLLLKSNAPIKENKPTGKNQDDKEDNVVPLISTEFRG